MPQPNTAQDIVLDRLLEEGSVAQGQVDRARNEAERDPDHPAVTYHLVRLGELTPQVLGRALAEHHGVEAFDFDVAKISKEVLSRLDEGIVRERLCVPVADEHGRLTVAMVDPSDADVLDELQFSAIADEIVPVVAGQYAIERFIEEALDGGDARWLEILEDLKDDPIERVEESDSELAAQEQIDEAPAVKWVDEILRKAVREGASDIHFEFEEHRVKVRFRIDGSLLNVLDTQTEVAVRRFGRAIVNRIKILSELKIEERQTPQDGRMKLRISDRVIDFRVSIVPAVWGENIVLRILDNTAVSLDLTTLGLRGREMEALLEAAARPYGMILVTGPTGSGKSTTLYSVLRRLNTPTRKTLTVEDPVEYSMDGITQVAVRRTNGRNSVTFATALRAFLRQDPDVIMVGEIRDDETAQIALEAALTGHLVLSTLHTNDAPSTITRLTEMGMEAFNVAAAVNTIIAQRLVRKICPRCREEGVRYGPKELARLHLTAEEAEEVTFCRGKGCGHCNNTGYKGRIGIFEVLSITREIEQMILGGASAHEIRDKALANGMRTLRMAGIDLIRSGETTLEEVAEKTIV